MVSWGYSIRKSADYSPYVVHFCKDTKEGTSKRITVDKALKKDEPLFTFKTSTGLEKLQSILKAKKIFSSDMPHVGANQKAVCFTECVWESILEHAKVYGRYGLGFNKKQLFDAGGGPALYLRGDRLKQLLKNFPSELVPFVTPFDPMNEMAKGVIDFVHEREWRVPNDLTFDYSSVEFVVVSTTDDVRVVSQQIGLNQIPANRYIVMDQYELVKKHGPDQDPQAAGR